jgi:amino acid adenylation domain-containing protein
MAQMSEDFPTLTASTAIDRPVSQIDHIVLLSDAERRQLLAEWDQSEQLCIHHLFEQQVYRTPEAIAVVFENRQLTYQELNTQANQLAHHLRSLGVTAETIVGIYLDRSLDMLIGLLGILKAGGVYIPLDPSYPADRIAFMLADSQAPVLLTQQSLSGQLEPLCGADRRVLVCIDRDRATIATQSDKNLFDIIAGDNLAYIIYTSGSTGKPKGVQISHQSLSNLLTSMQTALNATTSETFLAVTTISFDIAALELYLPLIVGAKLILVSRETGLDGNELLAQIATSGATVMQATPATWQMLIGCGLSTQPRRLKQILSGGEGLPRRLSQQLLAIANEVWNVYGPTETTIWSTAYLVDRQSDRSQPTLEPIGTAIANTELYILDDKLQPVVPGSFGELHIGGIGLARGYLNRPELTAEKFIPHPFNKLPGARLYKTGDWVCALPDGNLEYAERIDQQVKIRGFRIELGEIETALYQHAQVREAVVIAREDDPGNKRLVAYFVTNEAKPPTASEFRQHLQQTLPDYMIPAIFVQLPSLPLTPNCKIDRRALPAPSGTRVELDDHFVAPQDELELQLTEIWEQVLKVNPIGVTDNFFDLGGNSLLAMSLFAHIEPVCQLNLPLSAIFQAPTIAELAKVIRAQTILPTWYSLVPIQPQGTYPPLFIIHWLNYRDLYQHLGTERTIYGLHYGIANASTHIPELPSIEDLATHYIREMRELQPQGPYFLMGHSSGGTIAYEMAQQLTNNGQEVALLALMDTNLEENNRKIMPLAQKLANLYRIGWLELATRAKEGVSLKLHALKARYSASGLTNQDLFIEDPRILRAIENYTPKSYAGLVVLYQAIEQWISVSYLVEEPDVILRKFVGDKLEVHAIPGDHHSILKEPNVALIAKSIGQYIDWQLKMQNN